MPAPRVSFKEMARSGSMMVAPPELTPWEDAMTTEVVVSLPTAPAAARAQREALERVRLHQRSYSRLRCGRDIRAITPARTEWGLAVLEWINALVAWAEAADRRNPVWAAAEARGLTMFRTADPSHAECEQAWADYQEARRMGDQAAVTAARDAWYATLVDWHRELTSRRAEEDEQHVEDLLRSLDASDRLDPSDAFPPPPGSRAAELVRASRERARVESVRRDRMRSWGPLGGWRPAGR